MFRNVFFAAAVAAVIGSAAVAPLPALAVEVDLSTPKAAAKTFGQGMSEGDAAAVKAAALANDEQLQALEALVKVVSNFKKVEEAAVAKFGEAGKSIGNPSNVNITDELAKIDTAEETIEGDTATLQAGESPEPLHLRKVDGQWKVDFAAMPGSDQVGEALPMINAMADAATELADEISADKYKTADEARTALQQKMLAAMMSLQQQQQDAGGMGEPGTTEPATEDPADTTDEVPADDAIDAPDDAAAQESAAEEPPAEESPADEPAVIEPSEEQQP